MAFNSYVFILFFLPAVLAGYYLCFFRKGSRSVSIFLLTASVVFYVSAGWETSIVLLISILLNYGVFYGLKVCSRHRLLREGGGVNIY